MLMSLSMTNAIRAALESAGVIFHSSRLLLRIG
jgi:hypothetical protein